MKSLRLCLPFCGSAIVGRSRSSADVDERSLAEFQRSLLLKSAGRRADCRTLPSAVHHQFQYSSPDGTKTPERFDWAPTKPRREGRRVLRRIPCFLRSVLDGAARHGSGRGQEIPRNDRSARGLSSSILVSVTFYRTAHAAFNGYDKY